MEDEEENTENVLRILVATDIHLGFGEKEAERANDSFITFEEILSLGKEKDVDFILLGGDLFHENKPSRYTQYKCIQLLKSYTFGNKQINFEIVNERDKDSGSFLPQRMNYEDPNLNVSYPVFSIHGNHDDPTGRGNLCALDLLSEMGLINHFGKCLNLEDVRIKPLLFVKGETKLALYGLGAIRDQRLFRIFREGKISMIRPEETPQDWFNLLVVHQNRIKHSPTGYLPEECLDDFLDLVIWGHEHECIINPKKSEAKGYFIIQPGSSVATSLSVGEAVKKQIGILHIYKENFRMEEIPLKTVRPFCIEDISLENCSFDLKDDDLSSKVMEYCSEYVEQMIEDSKKQLTGNEKQPKIPLIRLRVEFVNDNETFSVVRFGQKFVNKVANSKDIILFNRKRQATENDLARFSAVEIVRRHFETLPENQRLEILTEKGLGKAVQQYVEKKEYYAISELTEHQKEKTATYLVKHMSNVDSLDEELRRFREQKQKSTDEDAELNKVLAAAKEMRIEKGEMESGEEMDVVDDDDDDDDIDDGGGGEAKKGKSTSSRGRGRGRGRGVEFKPEKEVEEAKVVLNLKKQLILHYHRHHHLRKRYCTFIL
ncbi:Double-strand break repair protein mre11a [Chamberlinius hualienensis]